MRPKNPRPFSLKDILSDLMDKKHGKLASNENPVSALQRLWPDLAGPLLSRKSKPLKIRGKCLIVGVAGSSWANELDYLKIHLMKKIKDTLPGLELTLEEIRFQMQDR